MRAIADELRSGPIKSSIISVKVTTARVKIRVRFDKTFIDFMMGEAKDLPDLQYAMKMGVVDAN